LPKRGPCSSTAWRQAYGHCSLCHRPIPTARRRRKPLARAKCIVGTSRCEGRSKAISPSWILHDDAWRHASRCEDVLSLKASSEIDSYKMFFLIGASSVKSARSTPSIPARPRDRPQRGAPALQHPSSAGGQSHYNSPPTTSQLSGPRPEALAVQRRAGRGRLRIVRGRRRLGTEQEVRSRRSSSGQNAVHSGTARQRERDGRVEHADPLGDQQVSTTARAPY